MAVLSPRRLAWPTLPGLPAPHRGKVRDSYSPRRELRLVVCTDGISSHDFVLNALVPQKGIILSALTHFWLTRIKNFGVRTHLVAAGKNIDAYLSEGLRGDPDLQARAMVVANLHMTPVEFVGRSHLTGSGLKQYKESGHVCGIHLPPGLQDGDDIGCIIDTPTTKAEVGHDEPIPADEIRKRFPEQTRLLIQVFQIMASWARSCGLVLADTKCEFGSDSVGNAVLGDEVGTPDSSRYWSLTEWSASRKKSERKAPTSLDKQLARQWAESLGVNQMKPENPEHVAQVHGFEVPEELIRLLTQTYRYLFWRLTGERLEEYLEKYLGVVLPRPKKKIAVILGSRSDLPTYYEAMRTGSNWHWMDGIDEMPQLPIHIVSCHRNPEELRQFVQKWCDGLDAVIAAGGMAFALPGVLDTHLHAAGKNIPVIGVALGTPGTEEFQAAQLSISMLPGQPVVMDEVNGDKVYAGSEGLRAALERVSRGELPPPRVREKKPAEFGIHPYPSS